MLRHAKHFLFCAMAALTRIPAGAAEDQVSVSAGDLQLVYNAAAGTADLQWAQASERAFKLSAEVEVTSETINLADARFTRKATVAQTTEPLLSGPAIFIDAVDSHRQFDWSLQLGLLNDRSAVTAKLAVTNVATTGIEVKRLQPARILVPSRPVKVLTHGRMYYDPGSLVDFGPDSKPIDSVFNAALVDPVTSGTLVAGFLDCEKAEGRIRTETPPDDKASIQVSADALTHSRTVIKPGQTLESGRVFLHFSDDGHEALETYADLLGKLHNVRLNPIINGWCTWFVYYGSFAQEDIRKNAEFVARELKQYGMDWVQVDDGYQRAFGDWEGNPERFPKGMKGVAEEIRGLGLKPGLWLAPFAVSAHSSLSKEHPEWLAHQANGELQPIVKEHQNQAQYILDTTHPGAREWMRTLFRTITEDWGYDFIKTDFVEWTILSAERFHQPHFTTAMAYRDGVAAQREGMGPNRHLLDCGPGPIVTGLIDSMRIGLDRPVPENPLWDQYGGFFNSTGAAVAKRYYFHNRAFIIDPDHLRMGGLTLPQAQAAASIVALSGGTLMSGDKLYELAPEKVEILKKVTPSFGKGARPLDLFENDQPELFLLPVEQSFGRWKILGAFNWGKEPRTRTLDLKTLRITEEPDPLVYDFWSGQLVPVKDGALELQQDPTSVRLVAIHPRLEHPQVIGTDRHVTQGGIEFESIEWNAAEKKLHGKALGAKGMEWGFTVHVPQAYKMKSAHGPASHTTEGNLLRVKLRFTSESTVWSLQF